MLSLKKEDVETYYNTIGKLSLHESSWEDFENKIQEFEKKLLLIQTGLVVEPGLESAKSERSQQKQSNE